MTVGFTNGCFDLLHEGHRYFLRTCREHCDSLVVAINSDSSVRRLKGEGRPVEQWGDRAGAVMATGLAAAVIAFDSEDELRFLIWLEKPAILFKGDEYRSRLSEITGWQNVERVVLVPMLPCHSTTAKIREMRQ